MVPYISLLNIKVSRRAAYCYA